MMFDSVVIVVLLALPSLIQTRSDSFFEETRATWDSDATVCSVDSPDETRIVSSKSRCAIECNQRSPCSGFDFNEDSRICELHSGPKNCCSYVTSKSFCRHFQDLKSPDYTVDNYGPHCVDWIHPENCSLPFTYYGSLFYGCATNVTSPGKEVGCFSTNRTWKTCCPPETFEVGYINETVTIPGLNVTIPVQSVNGWIVFQQRFNGMTNFAQPWTAYQTGFGVWNGEYWMGLEKIHQMTTQGSWTLRIELLGKRNATWGSVEYDDFVVESSVVKYRLQVSNYSWGDMPNVLNFAGNNYQNGMKFSAYDSDNDQDSGNCAAMYKGGFWYNRCWALNVNGDYKSVQFGYALLPELPNHPVMTASATRMMMKRIA